MSLEGRTDTGPDAQAGVQPRTRVALLVPASNTVMANDLTRALPPERFSVHVSRAHPVGTPPDAGVTTVEESARLAAKDAGATNPGLLVFGSISAGSLVGLDYDAESCRELGALAGCPALSVIDAVAQALRSVNARHVAVITPYDEDLTKAVAAAILTENRDIVAAYGMGITANEALADPTPDEIVAFARGKLAGLAFDTLFVACTNFRALDAKPALEEVFGATVVTSNGAVVDAIEGLFKPGRG